jgi:hypothetical protein
MKWAIKEAHAERSLIIAARSTVIPDGETLTSGLLRGWRTAVIKAGQPCGIADRLTC